MKIVRNYDAIICLQWDLIEKLFCKVVFYHYINITKGEIMAISNDDMMELKRLAANTYEQEKSSQIHRIINYINRIEGEVASLRAEVKKLKAELPEK